MEAVLLLAHERQTTTCASCFVHTANGVFFRRGGHDELREVVLLTCVTLPARLRAAQPAIKHQCPVNLDWEGEPPGEPTVFSVNAAAQQEPWSPVAPPEAGKLRPPRTLLMNVDGPVRLQDVNGVRLIGIAVEFSHQRDRGAR